jgi:hypothetical protein
MNDFWGALAVAIMSRQYLTPEQAFDRLWSSNLRSRTHQRKDISEQDVADMARMKSHKTYKQIGKLYGLDKCAVYNRVRRYREGV